MFGTDSGNNGWHGLNFIYECTRIYGVIFGPNNTRSNRTTETYEDSSDIKDPYFIELIPNAFDIIHENPQAHIQVKFYMVRLLSIWEEEGCRMVAISCENQDTHAANSQFITHLAGQMMGLQGLLPTPIDDKVNLHLNYSLSIFVFVYIGI